jgi:hypothetical protein
MFMTQTRLFQTLMSWNMLTETSTLTSGCNKNRHHQPTTGQVKSWIDLSGIYQSDDPNAVLNGIAYDSQTNRLFVTGKNAKPLPNYSFI